MGGLIFRLAETCSWLYLMNKSCFWTEFVILLLVILSKNEVESPEDCTFVAKEYVTLDAKHFHRTCHRVHCTSIYNRTYDLKFVSPCIIIQFK